MTAIDLLKRLHQHRAWVNGNLLAAAETLSPEQLRALFPMGQGSIWQSLTHLYGAEHVWLECLLGNEEFVVPGDLPGKLPGNQQGEGGIADLASLRQKWIELEKRWTSYLAGLLPEALEGMAYRKSLSLGIRLGIRRGDALLHVCTHAQYTTAQVVNMLRHSGVEKLPETMLLSLVRHETK